MIQIPDDPIISCVERTGYPPWMVYPEYAYEDWLEDRELWCDYYDEDFEDEN